MKKYTFVFFVFFLSFALLFNFKLEPAKAQASLCDGAPAVNQRVKVIATPSLRVRSAAQLGDNIISPPQYTNATGSVLAGGPVSADGYCWVNVNYDVGSDGWSATFGLEVVSSGSTPGGDFTTQTVTPGTITVNRLSTSNTLTVVPVYVGSITNNDVQAKAQAMAAYLASESGGHFGVTVNVTAPRQLSAFVAIPFGSPSGGSCEPPETANNTIFVNVGPAQSCTYNNKNFVASNTQNGLAHEYGHWLFSPSDLHAPGMMSPTDTDYINGYHFTNEQKQALGWPTTGGTTPPAPAPSGGSCPNPALPYCGNVVTAGTAGPFSLVCPAETVNMEAGGTGHVNLTATGDSIIGISAQLGTGRPKGLHDEGIRANLNPGFRPPGDATMVGINPGRFSDLLVNVDASVSGDHIIEIEGEVGAYKDFNGDGEPDRYSLFSTCKTNVHVGPSASSLPAGVSLHIYRSGQAIENTQIRQQQKDPNKEINYLGDSDIERTKLTWAAAGSIGGSCYLREGSTTGRLLGSGKEYPPSSFGAIPPPPLEVGPYAQDMQIFLVCDHVPGGSGPNGEVSVSTYIIGYLRLQPTFLGDSGYGPGGLTASMKLESANKIEPYEVWLKVADDGYVDLAHDCPEDRAPKELLHFKAGDTIPDALRVPGGPTTWPKDVSYYHCQGWVPRTGYPDISVPAGSSVLVTYSSFNATECKLNGVPLGGTNGKVTVSADSPLTLQLVCSNAAGDKVTVSGKISISGEIVSSSPGIDIFSVTPNSRSVFNFKGGTLVFDIKGTGKYSGNLNLTAVVDPERNCGECKALSQWIKSITFANNKMTVEITDWKCGDRCGAGIVYDVIPNGDVNAGVPVYFRFTFEKDKDKNELQASPNPLTLGVGEQRQITLSILPQWIPLMIQPIIYEEGFSEDSNIASSALIGNIITVRGVGVGQTNIWARLRHNDVSIRIPVTVTAGSSSMTTSSSLSTGQTGIVTASALNLRDAPGGAVEAVLPLGATVTILSAPVPTPGGYQAFQVQSGATTGYADTRYIQLKAGSSTTGTTTSGSTGVSFTAVLKVGSTGSAVVALQTSLNTKGYDCGTADGSFGPRTKACVVSFQSAYGLAADGIVGTATRTALSNSGL